MASLALLDIGARKVAEGHLEKRVVDAVQPDGEVSVQISSFPFLGHLLLSGRVSRVQAAVRDVTIRGIRFSAVGADLNKVTIDREASFEERRVALESIGRGRAFVEIDQQELSRLLGVRVVLEDGQARVNLGGGPVGVTARLDGRTLTVEAAGASLPTIPIPPLPIVDCLADIELRPGRLRLTCTVDEVPVELASHSLQAA